MLRSVRFSIVDLRSSIILCGLFVAAAGPAHAAAEEQAAPNARAASAQDQEIPPEHAKLMAEGLEIFRKQVKTLLVDRCLVCHNGADTTEGGFSLATREALLQGGKTGKAIVPGKSQESRLMRLVSHLEEPHMPKLEDKLADEQIAQLAAWIDRFAPYDGTLGDAAEATDSWTTRTVGEKAREFWSFQPLRHAPPPDISRCDWPTNAVDRFVLSRLESAGLAPSAEVDRRRLIRRLSFDLVGLPPEPDAIEEFVNDPDPDALGKLVDRLLADPHYGERWARHWLDLARFAESHGFEHDYDRATAYHYRDFVIRALNEDLPYDTFIKWQLAGDEFAPDDNLAMMATGFLAAGVHSTQITKNEVEKHRYDELDDILATTGTAMLGLTIGCARCHDHKFDPFPQSDYYRLLSAFTTTVRSEVELNFDKEGYRQAREHFDADHAPLVEALRRFEAEQLAGRFAAWDTSRTAHEMPGWLELEPSEMKSSGGATFEKLDDGSILVAGAAARETWTFTATAGPQQITGVRIEAISHPQLPGRGPGRGENGNFALSDLKVAIAPQDAPDKPAAVALKNPRTTFEQQDGPVGAAVDGDGKSFWGIASQTGKSHAAAFELAQPIGYPAGSIVAVTLSFEHEKLQLGRLRISVNTAKEQPPLEAVGAPADVIASLAAAPASRTAQQTAKLVKWFRRLDPEYQALEQKADDHLAAAPRPDLRQVLVSSEGLPALRLHTQGQDFFPETFFLRRGDPNQKDGVAPVGFLQVLTRASNGNEHWPVAAPSNARTSFRRTALANWISDADKGAGDLLARVIVNRLWQHHFGRGIVATPSDFGTRGEAPSHPELLDFLASELIRHEWQLKPIHKLMLTSGAYRQDSAFRPEAAAIDPDNRLCWRHSRRRLEGEVIRDALLAAGGALEQRMYGPGTLDENQRRRSIYFTVKRSQLAPMMQVFDAPDALTSVGDRPSTTIAPQALMLLNNPAARDWSRSLARRVSHAGSAPAETVRLAYLAAVGRTPTDQELAESQTFLHSQSQSYSRGGGDGAEAALVDFCQILLCLNEFVYVD